MVMTGAGRRAAARCSLLVALLGAVLAILTVLPLAHAAGVENDGMPKRFQTPESRMLHALNGVKSSYPNPIPLGTREFDLLVGANRNYSIIVVFTTASPKMNCEPCQKIVPIISVLTQTLHRSIMNRLEQPIFVSTLDFMDGREIFQRMGIQSIPMVVHYPPDMGPYARPAGKMDIFDNMEGFTSERLSEWISAETGRKIVITTPLDIPGVLFRLSFTATLIGLVYVAYPYVKKFIFSKRAWTVFCTGWTVVMCSGHMFTSMRGTPYTGISNGRPQLVSGGFQYQFGIEPQMVSFLYSSISIIVIILITKIPNVSSPIMQRRYALGATVAMLILYSAMLALFRLKYPSYPYALFF